jgi:outer membrane protein with beta-barrel domain
MLTRLTLIGALALVLPTLASAQGPAAAPHEAGPAVVVFANGGGGSPLSNLNDAGTADFKTGWSVGGGAGVQVNQYLAIRGVFDYLRSEGEESSIAFAGQHINNYFYGGDLQLRYPTASGFAPYLLAGAGAVTINNQDDATFNSFTKFAGKGGLGLEYASPNNGAGIFVQGTSYIYKFDQGGFDKTQYDILWTAGLSYRFGH